MQCFKLVNGGFVDKVIVFDSLPERLTRGVRTKEAAGFPRAWAKWLSSIFKTETTVDMARNWTYKHTPVGQEPCFFVLDYTDVNADKERWRQIGEYLRMNVGPEVRLKEKIEDMALQLATDCKQPLLVEPEDVPVIPVPLETVQEVSHEELVKPGEQILVQEPAPKKRGRPKKIAVEV